MEEKEQKTSNNQFQIATKFERRTSTTYTSYSDKGQRERFRYHLTWENALRNEKLKRGLLMHPMRNARGRK
jgi:hypothetical protein